MSESPEVTEQIALTNIRVPLDYERHGKPEELNRGADYRDVEVRIDPDIGARAEYRSVYGETAVVLREWNEQVLLHELIHVALSRVARADDDPLHHNIVSRIEVALWETGWRFRPDAEARAERAEAALAERDAAMERVARLVDHWDARGFLIPQPGRPHPPAARQVVAQLRAALDGDQAREGGT